CFIRRCLSIRATGPGLLVSALGTPERVPGGAPKATADDTRRHRASDRDQERRPIPHSRTGQGHLTAALYMYAQSGPFAEGTATTRRFAATSRCAPSCLRMR